MAEYISKDALVAEIRKLIEDAYRNNKFYVTTDQLNSLKRRINTFEVKEVDSKDAFIEKACDAYCAICDTKECQGCAKCTWVIKFRRQLLKY